MLPRDRRAWEQKPIGVSNREAVAPLGACRPRGTEPAHPRATRKVDKLGARLVLLHCNSAERRRQACSVSATSTCSVLDYSRAGFWHGACDTFAHHSAGQGGFIGADTLEGITRLAVALSLLASYKSGRGGGWRRARQRVARIVASGPQRQRELGGRASSPTPGPVPEPKHRRFRLHVIVAGLWIALSLLVVGYATIRGEVAFAELDGLDLVATYSWGPVAPLLDSLRD